MDLTDPQQWNAYAYANNNPTTLSDPDGLIPADCREFDCYVYDPSTGCPGGCGSTANLDWGRANGKTSTKTNNTRTGGSNSRGGNSGGSKCDLACAKKRLALQIEPIMAHVISADWSRPEITSSWACVNYRICDIAAVSVTSSISEVYDLSVVSGIRLGKAMDLDPSATESIAVNVSDAESMSRGLEASINEVISTR